MRTVRFVLAVAGLAVIVFAVSVSAASVGVDPGVMQRASLSADIETPDPPATAAGLDEDDSHCRPGDEADSGHARDTDRDGAARPAETTADAGDCDDEADESGDTSAPAGSPTEATGDETDAFRTPDDADPEDA